MSRVSICLCIALLAAIYGFKHVLQQRESVINALNTEVAQLKARNTTLTQERDQARAALSLQAKQINRANQVAEEARQARQKAELRAEKIRQSLHTGISTYACSNQLLPADDAERLLRYVTHLRDEALHPDAKRTARPNTTSTPTESLTWGQAIEWIPLLLGNVESCNRDKAALRRIDKEKANETTQAQ
ncbi:hypothetical protein GL912_06125 [Shigella sonnei]|nr:hypothetical protein [Shigella sonnei]